MPEYLAPGVFIEEVSTGPKPIEGVGTSTAGFVGETERGPLPPNLISSLLAFQRWYGGFLPHRSYLPYAIKGFFDNGGKRCFISRIAPAGATIAQGQVGNLIISANGPGAWANRIRIRIDNSSRDANNPNLFRLTVIYYDGEFPDPFIDPLDPDEIANPDRRDPTCLEDLDDLTFVEGRSNNAVTRINSSSKLIKCWWAGGPANAARPDNVAFDGAPLANGTDGGAAQPADFMGNTDPIRVIDQEPPLNEPLGRGRGLAALKLVDEVAILSVPDEVRHGENVRRSVLLQCEELKDRFAIISSDQGQSPGNLRPTRPSLYGGFYHPWIKIFDAVSNRDVLVPPSGHVAGIFARTDIERGVHKAPANEIVRGALDLEFPVTRGDQEILNPRGVNCIRDFRPDGRGIRLWGARTMSDDPEWKYVSVRRLFIFVEESVEEATQWVVFEPNHEPTWAKVSRSIINFLIRIWKNGALQGVTQEEAFFVKCDRTTMTQDDIDNGRLICLIGMAPVKPAEFVIFRFSQKTLEAQT